MKIAVYTLTRDRIEYTKKTLVEAKATAGIEFDYYVLDNGSIDGTQDWLKKHEYLFKKIFYSDDNKGLWRGINILLKETNNFEGYDFVLKLDNDVEFPHENWLKELVDVYNQLEGNNWILCPYVDGLGNGKGGAARSSYLDVGQHKIGYSNFVGGICLFTNQAAYRGLEFPPNRPKAKGWDVHFCGMLKGEKKYKIAYTETIKIKHRDTSDGQNVLYPEYRKRKLYEVHTPYEGDDNSYHV